MVMPTPTCLAAMQAIMLTSSESVTAMRISARAIWASRRTFLLAPLPTIPITSSSWEARWICSASRSIRTTSCPSWVRMFVMWKPTSPAPTTTTYMGLPSRRSGPASVARLQGRHVLQFCDQDVVYHAAPGQAPRRGPGFFAYPLPSLGMIAQVVDGDGDLRGIVAVEHH